MKSNHLFILPLFFALTLTLIGCSYGSESAHYEDTLEPAQLRHVVLFSFTESSTPDDIRQIEEAFAALPSQIDVIQDFEWGINNSPEGLDKGFTHCFIVTFQSEEGRDIYLPHPAHQEFVELLSPHLDDVLVVDYWVR
ncbi:MAG: Dabb family protein [Balneolaceae bacterium]|nr:Dabb family protein [Balneolaceae bacterium]